MSEPVTHINRELLLLIAGGDSAAFEEFFKHFWPQVYGTSLHLTKSEEMAKDLAQEIFVKIWENRQKLPDVEKPDAWIYTLSKNLILDFQRKKVFDTVNIDYLVQYFSTASPQSKLEYQELEQVLNTAVSQLSGKVAEVFRLSRYEGLSHPEIAEKLNISPETAKYHIAHALKTLRLNLKHIYNFFL